MIKKSIVFLFIFAILLLFVNNIKPQAGVIMPCKSKIESSITYINDFNKSGAYSLKIVTTTKTLTYEDPTTGSCYYSESTSSRIENYVSNQIIHFSYSSNDIAPEVEIYLIDDDKLYMEQGTEYDVYKVHRDLPSLNYDIYNHWDRNKNLSYYPSTEEQFLKNIFPFFYYQDVTTYETHNDQRDNLDYQFKEINTGWTLYKDYQTYFHQLGPIDPETGYDPYYNNKYVNGGQEVVYNSKLNKKVTDSLNMGTYNYYGSIQFHYIYDVYPYLIWGNDRTDMYERTVTERFTWDKDSSVSLLELLIFSMSYSEKNDTYRRLSGSTLLTKPRPSGVPYSLIEYELLYGNDLPN